MDRIYSGIVLLPANGVRKRSAILDRSLGHISVISKNTLFAGSVISYRLQPFSGGYFLSDVEIEYVPFHVAAQDLLFLHHILELCYYFIPIGSCIVGVFEVVHWVYALDELIQSRVVKKYAIMKLLTTLGLWPEQHYVNTRVLSQLIAKPIDRITLQDIDLASERELDQWLRFCILQHPCSSKLQTMTFLSQGTQE